MNKEEASRWTSRVGCRVDAQWLGGVLLNYSFFISLINFYSYSNFEKHLLSETNSQSMYLQMCKKIRIT